MIAWVGGTQNARHWNWYNWHVFRVVESTKKMRPMPGDYIEFEEHLVAANQMQIARGPCYHQERMHPVLRTGFSRRYETPSHLIYYVLSTFLSFGDHFFNQLSFELDPMAHLPSCILDIVSLTFLFDSNEPQAFSQPRTDVFPLAANLIREMFRSPTCL